MNYTEQDYKTFSSKMEEKYPKMFSGQYGGFSVGPGWWHIVEKLCENIQRHVEQVARTRELLLKNNPRNIKIPNDISQFRVAQVKEKFGGLRFYYDYGDDAIYGMVQMAETWASVTCEQCGAKGQQRGGGWIRTLCDQHEAEYQERNKDSDVY